MKRATIVDVAESAGVSISTVSRFLSNPLSISPIRAVAIDNAIKKLNYIPNPFAQNIRKESTKIIAVIMPDISDQFFSDACKALCDIFYQNEYFVMICDTDNDPEKERYYISEMIKSRVAGIMLITCGQNKDFIQGIIDEGHLLMLIDRLEPGVEINAVCEDNTSSGYELAKYLLQVGHRRFAILSGSEKSINMYFRISGIEKALWEFGIEDEEKYLIKNLRTKEDAVSAFASLTEDKNCPRCIIACNNVLLDGVVLEANKQQLSVPEQYAIAGFCVEDPRFMFPFPVPAILQIPKLMGMKAGDLMLNQLKRKRKKSKQLLLKTKLILP